MIKGGEVLSDREIAAIAHKSRIDFARKANPSQIAAAERVNEAFSCVFRNAEIEMLIHPAFASGRVSAKVSHAELSKADMFRLEETLWNCDRLKIGTDGGRILIEASIPHVFVMR